MEPCRSVALVDGECWESGPLLAKYILLLQAKLCYAPEWQRGRRTALVFQLGYSLDYSSWALSGLKCLQIIPVCTNNKITMHTKYAVGRNTLPPRNLMIKEAILNAQKTSQVVKSEIQISKMTNLLKIINTENEYLNKELIKLSGENKQLKKALGTKGVEKTAADRLLKTTRGEYGHAYSTNKVQSTKPVAVDHLLASRKSVGESMRDSPTFRIDRDSRARQYKSTQTSPSRRLDANQMTISADRTPQKPRQSPNPHENPQNTQKKKQRALSMHRINPSSSAGLRDPSLKSSQSGSQQPTAKRQNVHGRDSYDGQAKKRYLSLVSLKK